MKQKISEKKIGKDVFIRIPIKTKILNSEDNIIEIVERYTAKILEKNDIIIISESPVAITQGRAINEDEINPGILAKLLWRGVKKVNYGIGLRSKISMQCAIDECGKCRIIFAAAIGFICKLIGKSGMFYKIAGKQAALIDAAHTSPIPPYDKTVIKGPIHTDKICRKIKEIIGNETAIMDINDIGGSWVIGKSTGIDANLLEKIMSDNPQGQQDELTPICIVREKND
ncbi:MAG: coenzyme F420-0:L-glutamate ligase [Candidatus Cloacimonetes bacterium]|nr:coenzyme F420-0:L-glutamate ligase [Candidatus Cloacimonadota bacterium]